MECSFLREVISAAGFNDHLANLIMSSISSTSLSLLWNGKRLDKFQPYRGLQQGDSLSPYLFVLCMEVLGRRISKAVLGRVWKPLKASRVGLVTSHLFFVDDLLLFGAATHQQARTMELLLLEFCNLSGQKVNHRKSSL